MEVTTMLILSLIAVICLALLWATYATVAEQYSAANYKSASADEDVIAMTAIGAAGITALMAAAGPPAADFPNLLLATTVAAAALGLAIRCSRKLHTERAARVRLTLAECGDAVHVERRVAADKGAALHWAAKEDYNWVPARWRDQAADWGFQLLKLRITWYVARQGMCTMQDVYTDLECSDLDMYAACHELVMEGRLDGRSIYEDCISNHTEVGLSYNL